MNATFSWGWSFFMSTVAYSGVRVRGEAWGAGLRFRRVVDRTSMEQTVELGA